MYQIYRFKPGYHPRKTTIDSIISVYPNVSAEWITSGVGDMMTVRPDVELREEKADQFLLPALTPVQILELQERILKIVDICENGSKSQFSAKTRMNQVYSLPKPGYQPRKTTIDRIISAYPDISAEWLASGTGDMTTVRPDVEHGEEKTDQSPVHDPSPGRALELYERILKIIDTCENGSKNRFADKTGIRTHIYKPGYKPRKINIDRIISAYPDISAEWLASGTGDMTTVRPGIEHGEEKTDQSPVHDPSPVRALELHERILKIIDICENGSKYRFADKTGIRTHIYRLLQPGYQPRKINIDRIISAYPNISVEWITSGTGDMTPAYPGAEHGEEKTDQSPVHDPSPVQSRKLQERILKIIDTFENGSRYRFAAKTGIRHHIYRLLQPGYNPGKVNIDRIISAYPDISAEWLASGIGDMTTVRPDVEHREEKTDQSPLAELPDQIQSPVHDSISVQNLKSIDNKSYIQALELQIQTILKINEGLLSDYQKVIGINRQLNNAVIELTEKVIGFNSKI
ncbi:MAG: hypothetical protein LBL04_17225 [Bacteroidales bacterium]|nr:hypothetical protein [Bacteroidales bacterium]